MSGFRVRDRGSAFRSQSPFPSTLLAMVAIAMRRNASITRAFAAQSALAVQFGRFFQQRFAVIFDCSFLVHERIWSGREDGNGAVRDGPHAFFHRELQWSILNGVQIRIANIVECSGQIRFCQSVRCTWIRSAPLSATVALGAMS
jgi:hypothetical protein